MSKGTPTGRTAKDLRDKYPDRIPVIVSKSQSCNLNEIDKERLIAHCDVGFQYGCANN